MKLLYTTNLQAQLTEEIADLQYATDKLYNIEVVLGTSTCTRVEKGLTM
jgi:hypothetical protein